MKTKESEREIEQNLKEGKCKRERKGKNKKE